MTSFSEGAAVLKSCSAPNVTHFNALSIAMKKFGTQAVFAILLLPISWSKM
jgi:hypothetical protein